MMSRRLMSVVLAVALISVPATALAADSEGIVYTAIGDSIAVGTGGTDLVGYVDLLEEHLAQVYGPVTLNECYHDGMTSEMLLDYLYTEPTLQYAVQSADLMTISIGANDILGPVLGYYYKHSSLDPASMTPEQLAMLIAELDALLGPRLQAFGSNWVGAMTLIRMANPTAEIYVCTIYNPFEPGDGFYELCERYLDPLNAAIIDVAASYGCVVVDVRDQFDDYANPIKPIVWGLDSDVALHPTDRGYKFIYNLHKDAMDD